MPKRNLFTRILAIVGATLVCFPILAPFVFAIIALVDRGRFLFDYLMPAELFPVVVLGGFPLLWAAVRAKMRQHFILWSLIAAVLLVLGSQVIASVTGLANGTIEPTGFWWILVLTMLGLYCVAVVMLGVGGILLVKDLIRNVEPVK